MLGTILKKEVCINCKNCCVFYSKSRWEMPEIPAENADKIREFLKCENAVKEINGKIKMNGILRDEKCNKRAEEYRCPALDESKGCTLPEELKPIECSMWPVRVMNDGEKIYVSLASTCHGADNYFKNNLMKLLNESLKKDIIGIVKKDKSIIKEYDQSYEKLIEITEELNEG